MRCFEGRRDGLELEVEEVEADGRGLEQEGAAAA